MKLDWRRGALYITTIGMQYCYLHISLVLIEKTIAPGSTPFIGLWGIFFLAFAINKLVHRAGRHRFLILLINIVASITVVLLLLKFEFYPETRLTDSAWLLAVPRSLAQLFLEVQLQPALIIFVCGTILWWLGRRLSRIRVSFIASIMEFQFGLVIFLIIYLITSLININLTLSLPLTFVFFAFALLGAALSHSQESTGWVASPNRRFWMMVLLSSTALIITLGLGVSLIAPDLIKIIIDRVVWLWNILWRIMLMGLELLSRLIPLPGMKDFEPTQAPGETGGDVQISPFKIPPWFMNVFRSGWTILMLLLTLIAIWRLSSWILAWLRRRVSNMTGAELEPLENNFKADILGFLKRLMLWLFGRRLSLWPKRRKEKLSPEVVSVRQIYRQLLGWAASGGWPMFSYQTPNEYLQVLEEAAPAATEALQNITRQYVNTRYGSVLPTDNELHQLKQTWQQVKQQKLKKTHAQLAQEKEELLERMKYA